MECRGLFEGTDFVLRIFSLTTDARGMTVSELVEADIADTVEPGLALIRDSFQFSSAGR